MTPATVVRCERKETQGVEALHWLWVVSGHGAVSTWFSDVRHIIGHSVCSGRAVHSPVPRDDFEEHGPCEFLESPCWSEFGSMLWLEPIVEAYDGGDMETVWAWLTAGLERLAP